MKIEIPIFDAIASYDDTDNVGCISFVEHPAVEVDFVAFKNTAANMNAFTVADEDKRIVTGVLMLADTPIYRNDEMGEYYINFPRKELQKMVQKFFRGAHVNKFNFDHNPEKELDGIYQIESFFKDSERGVVPPEFKDVPDGSWIGSFYVENDDVWSEIKAGKKMRGFSIEVMYDMERRVFKSATGFIDLLTDKVIEALKN